MTFTYDPFGRRIQKSSASGTTNYLYDGAASVEEIDLAGTLLARYTQGAGIDEPLAQLRNGNIVYYGQDGLSSVTSLSTSTVPLANTYSYDAFGNLTTSTGAFANPFQYTGRDSDSETGLRYYRARYYDSMTGRFLSEDPTGFDEGVNFYSYVANSPVGFVDPTGLALTPAACKKILERIILNTEILEKKITKYDPEVDGVEDPPYRGHAGHLGKTTPGIHYVKILELQAAIWVDVTLYQNGCKDGPKCPQKVYEIASKKIPKPVYPSPTPFADWVEEQKWEWQRAWRDFMNPHNPPWWFWFNPNAGRPKPAW